MWETLNQSLLKQMPKSHRDWLVRPYTLSEHFEMACQQYHFELKSAKWRQVSSEEQALLNCPQDQEIFEREIVHQDGDVTLADGVSIIPKETYNAFEADFQSLGDKAIGASFLYDNPAVSRSEFYFRFDGQKWCRASVFTISKGDKSYALLVIEKFRDNLPAYASRHAQKNQSSKFQAYQQLMRLHKPKPILLSLWPTYWGLWLASDGRPGWKLFLIFTLGTILMRSCGCVLNDLADRNFDGFVERTRMRPIATGMVSLKEALSLAFIIALMAFGLVCLTNSYTIAMSFAAMGLTLLYPLMKRFTHFPQIVLGFAFNFGVLMSFTAVQNHIPGVAWVWYVSAVIWTVMYDSWYALADRADDIKIGIKSTAVFFGRYAHHIILLLQVVCLTFWFVMLDNANAGLWSYIFLIAAGVSLATQNALAAHRTPAKYIAAFSHNHWTGLWVFLAIFCLF